MAERLTRNNKVNFCFHDEASNMVYYKLQDLEDIMEKYGIENVEELDKKLANFDNFMKGNKFETIEDLQNAINGKFIEVFDEKNKIWQDMVKNLTKTEQDRDTWKRACELACQIIISGYCDSMEDTTDWEDAVYQWKEDNSIETYGIGVEELLEYLLEQAKKEGEQK